jgi:ligand-binding sensor domain-containing protein
MIQTFIFSFFLFLLSSGLFAQKESSDRHAPAPLSIEVEHLTIRHGLSQSSVNFVIQDKKGFLWVGTEDGLNRFDGYGFKVFRHDPNNLNSLSNNFVTALMEDHAGNLWVGTRIGGLNRLNPSNGTCQRFVSDPDSLHSLSSNYLTAIAEDRNHWIWAGTNCNGLNQLNPATQKTTRFRHNPDNAGSISNDSITCVYTDRQGTVWVGTNGGGLCQYNSATGTFSTYRKDSGKELSLSDDHVWSIQEDHTGDLWIGTSNGLNRFDRPTRTFIHFRHQPDRANSLSNNHIRSLAKRPKGGLWVGTEGGGLNHFDPSSGQWAVYRHQPGQENSLTSDKIKCVYEDRSGQVWVGSGLASIGANAGLDYFHPDSRKFITYRTDLTNTNSLSSNFVVSLYEDRSGILWIGTYEGGLNRLDRHTGQFTTYQHQPGQPQSLSNNFITSVLEDHSGKLWLGTLRGGLNRFDRSTGQFKVYHHDPANQASLINDLVLPLLQDRTGTLWIGTFRGLEKFNPATETFTHFLHVPNDPNSLSDNTIRSLYQDKLGIIWIGTQTGGLNRFDPRTNTFSHFKHSPHDPKSLSSNSIYAILEDHRGRLWLGTAAGGLNCLDRETATFTSYTVKDGLPNDVVYGILEDDRGHLWLSTNQGLCKFDPETKKCTNYSEKDGLQSNEFNATACFKNRKGEMFFGGINGFNVFHPDSVRNNTYVPPIEITGFRVFDTLQTYSPDEIQLSYRENFLAFEFAALNYLQPEKNQYAYMLEGFDKNWIYCGTRRYASYTNLNSGTYTFRVKGSNNDGVWNQTGTAIRLVITPPFWTTWWFIALCLISLTSLVYLGYRNRIAQIRKEEQLKSEFNRKLGEVEMMALRAQMNPHFLFNCLNSINSFIMENDPDAASEYLTKFSRLIRLILNNSQPGAVTLASEIESIRLYVEMEAMRFNNRFSYKIIVDDELEINNIEIPPLLIQPYVENAIWHGLMHRDSKGHLNIEFHQDDKYLCCSIEDDGVGRQQARILKSKSATRHKSMGMQITSDRMAILNQLSHTNASVEVVDLVNADGQPGGTKVVVRIPI